jgi:hypothetical protein
MAFLVQNPFVEDRTQESIALVELVLPRCLGDLRLHPGWIKHDL